MASVQEIRQAILSAPLEISNFGEVPQPGTLYLPMSHMKALRLDANVIVGGRGVGKSFWTAALKDSSLHGLLGIAADELRGIDVRVGSGGGSSIDESPDADVFSAFLGRNGDPYDLWRAVVLRWVAERANNSLPVDTWQSTVDWMKANPEAFARVMQQQRSWRGLILFDALDRTSSDWKQMDQIVRGLLRMVLWLKSHAGLYAKVFLREDQAARTVFDFPDASKLISTKAELTWLRHDLHGMLWQRLINAPGEDGVRLREICPNRNNGEFWTVSPEMKTESETQRGVFEKLAGVWMGRDKRRGVPYVWSVSHLADGRGQTSPRSFLAAIRQATEDSELRYAQHGFTLHYESIKRGIQKASEIRVQEMAEDYPWVPRILSVLKPMNVPCEFEDIRAKWTSNFPSGPSHIAPDQLPAQHADRGWDGIRDDLERLGLMETKKDGRMDMPDLYRVGFGLGRRGGVKPR